MDTEVDVPNPSLALIPGMYAEVDLHLQERNGIVAVPVDAVEGTGANARVFQVSDNGAVHVVPVVVGLQTSQFVEIQQGIDEGAKVVVGRRTGLKEGDRVKAVTATSASAEQGK
jgi:multidrug efflux pump subunit AcrA (membrane-fusion protein)